MSAATVMPAASKPRRAPKKAAPAAASPAMPSDSPATRTLPLSLLDDHPDNPRSQLRGIEELAATIELDGGLLQALIVVPSHRMFGAGAVDDGRFTIVAGHRRRVALELLGRTEARCEVREDLDARAVRGAMLTENLQRDDLTALEEAEAFDKLVGDGWSQREIAAAAGCTQGQVSKRLSLLRLDPAVQQAVREERLSVADAVELGKLDEPRSQKRAYERMRGLHGHGMARNVVDALADERREVAREHTYEQACAQVKAAGWPRVTNRPSYETAEQMYRSPDQKTHQKGPLPCYAVYVELSGGVTHYCTKPRSHSKAKTADPHAEKERRDRRERKRAMDLRAAAAAQLAQVGATSADGHLLRDLSAIALAGWMHSAAAGFAAEWLRPGFPGLPDSGFAARSHVAASGDDRLRRRFLGAMILGHCEGYARDTHRLWGRQEALYIHRLTVSTGGAYSPTDWEREKLRDQAGVLDVDAFLSTSDPAAHLPGQPTLHDDLGTEPGTQPVERIQPAEDLL
jgi:ParB/RepB/Spo0J family partition protein